MTAVVLSVDAELAWGGHGHPESPRHVETARDSWSRLLAVLDEFDVPATWAVVGHLFLPECDGEHAEHPTPTDDWFGGEPGGRAARSPLWFAGGLVEAIADADADHEIAGQPFSHVGFDDERTTREVAVGETRASLEAAADAGFSLESFVLPGNQVAHRDVLAAYGVTCYRGGRPPLWFDDARLQTLARTVDLTVSKTSPPLVEPEVDDYGLVNVPASMSLFDFEGRTRTLLERTWDDPMVRAARRGIDRAADGDGVFHLWLQPNDLGDDRDFERLRSVLEHLDAVRDETGLPVRTMGEMASDLRVADPATSRMPIGPR
jgi:hypothetical protein